MSVITEPAAVSAGTTPRLRRVLNPWELLVYGMVLIQPNAAQGTFGLTSKISGGHALTVLLVAMFAMILTAVSYGRMATRYPSAGSAYTYVGKGLNPHLGFLAGWTMFLDYMMVPIVGTIYASLSLQRLVPGSPYWFWVACIALSCTLLNLKGIRTTVRSNIILLFVTCAVVAAFFVAAIHHLVNLQGLAGLFSSKPFYNPETFDFDSIRAATSLAALTYIGFDGVTTLAEDVRNPKRTMLIVTVLICLLTGMIGASMLYLAQLAWPDYNTFPNLETAFMDVTGRVGGPLLFSATAVVAFLICYGTIMAAQAGASRLLFGMGRDNVLPRKIFGHLDVRRNSPSYNILIIGVLTGFGPMILSYQTGAELLNFGAFLAFMGVNIAAFKQFYLEGGGHRSRRFLRDAFPQIAGFLFCLGIWISLPLPAKLIGGAWFLAGAIYLVTLTRGFRKAPIMLDLNQI